VAPKDEFLVFEDGPSVDVTLQWATYQDASDQTSLSRIWGGIHPPTDDIPGRLLGEQIGIEAFDKAIQYFSGDFAPAPDTPGFPYELIDIYPNPVQRGRQLILQLNSSLTLHGITVFDALGREVFDAASSSSPVLFLDTARWAPGVYFVHLEVERRSGQLPERTATYPVVIW
jgi:hypothetical protein